SHSGALTVPFGNRNYGRKDMATTKKTTNGKPQGIHREVQDDALANLDRWQAYKSVALWYARTRSLIAELHDTAMELYSEQAKFSSPLAGLVDGQEMRDLLKALDDADTAVRNLHIHPDRPTVNNPVEEMKQLSVST